VHPHRPVGAAPALYWAGLSLGALHRYIGCMPPLDFPPDQLPRVNAVLAELSPPAELTFRLALRGLFPRCRGGEWKARIEELLLELVTDEATLARYLDRAETIAADLDFGTKKRAERSR